jgi:hypothetical protein
LAKHASLRGGMSTRARKRRLALKRGLDVEALGPLNSPQDAERWAEAAVMAVATGSLSASAAQALRALLNEWRAAHQAGRVDAEFKALQAAIAEWRRTGEPGGVLKVVQGGRR